MTAYLIARVKVEENDDYAAYRERVPAVIAQYGGRYVVRGGPVDVLEGDREKTRVVVIAFADRAAARRFYDSPEYQAIVGLRHATSTADIVVADGYDG
ncbi:MAG: DUF1330 domain-containing protein [Alphaproteobacteria bacterium]